MRFRIFLHLRKNCARKFKNLLSEAFTVYLDGEKWWDEKGEFFLTKSHHFGWEREEANQRIPFWYFSPHFSPNYWNQMSDLERNCNPFSLFFPHQIILQGQNGRAFCMNQTKCNVCVSLLYNHDHLFRRMYSYGVPVGLCPSVHKIGFFLRRWEL